MTIETIIVNNNTEKPPIQKANRFNDGKLKWSLIDWESLEELVRVLQFGATKYDSHNWKKGLYTLSICNSLLRHIFAFMAGEDKDKESGLAHTGHMLANVMFLSYMVRNKAKKFDDRTDTL